MNGMDTNHRADAAATPHNWRVLGDGGIAALVAFLFLVLFSGHGSAAEEDFDSLKATCLNQLQKNVERRTQELAKLGVTRDEECHATAHIGRGNFTEAAEAFSVIAAKLTDEPQLHAFYLRLAAKGWIGGDNFAKAEETYDAAIAALPDWDVSRVERAVLLLHADRFAEAAEDLNYVLDADPDNVAALMERGWLNRLTGNADGARADWQRVIELDTSGDAAGQAERVLKSMEEKGR